MRRREAENKEIRDESSNLNDFLQFEIEEHDFNSTLKSIAALRWYQTNLSKELGFSQPEKSQLSINYKDFNLHASWLARFQRAKETGQSANRKIYKSNINFCWNPIIYIIELKSHQKKIPYIIQVEVKKIDLKHW